MSDFSDRPFVAGSLIGLRAFDVDSLGRLVGPQFPAVFGPGENVGTCYKGSNKNTSLTMSMWQLDVQVARMQGRRVPPPPSSGLRENTAKHQIGEHGCSCGFYAYFDGGNDWKRPERVTAVVEGYGVCTVGSRGFRAEKSRLVAFVLPTQAKGFDVFGRRVPALWLALAALNLEGVIRCSIIGHWWSFGFALFGLVMCGWNIGTSVARKPKPGLRLLRRNYPDVPVFKSKRAALKAHPLTLPPPPSPEEEDFWTRSAS